jgi:hypothetical protein
MSNSSDEEPIRMLSKEEYAALQGQERPQPKSRLQINANKIANGEMAVHEEGREIGLKVWEMRKSGKPKRKIVKELGISEAVIDTCLAEFETRMGMEAARMMEHYRMLDDERIEEMMSYWLPIAVHGRIRIAHIREGEVYSEVDFDRPLKAGFFCLQAMNMRLKLMSACRPEQAKESGTNTLIWLQQVMPGITKVVREVEAARDSLVLETEAEK